MKAAVYSPYLETLGGGERYIASICRALLSAGYSVHLESKNKGIIAKIEAKFGFKLPELEAVDSIRRGDGYDLCFWLSDGSVPTLLARKNILHFQRPFRGVDGKSLLSRMKFFRINKVVVNSQFTKNFIDQEYPVESVVLYPPVDVAKFKPGKKENLILYVGRFSQLEQAKRQDILLEAFKKLFDGGPTYKDWRLVLAGGSEVGRTQFVDELKDSAKYYPIKIIENPSFKELKDLYSKAKIFWSASGYGVNEEKEPQKVEHFGITVVEAMAAGAVPIIFNAGGHKEIIQVNLNGRLWTSVKGLLDETKSIINNSKTCRRLSVTAKKDAQEYSYERFEKNLQTLL